MVFYFLLFLAMTNNIYTYSWISWRKKASFPLLFMGLSLWNMIGQNGSSTLPKWKNEDIKINFSLIIDPNNSSIRFKSINDSTLQILSPGPTADWYRILANVINGGSIALQKKITDGGNVIGSTIKKEIASGITVLGNELKKEVSRDMDIARDTFRNEIDKVLESKEFQALLHQYKITQEMDFIFKFSGSVCFNIASLLGIILLVKKIRNLHWKFF